MKKIHKERLLKLASVLMRLRPTPEKQFHLDQWGAKADCGTTACAVGTATCHPWFNRRGFKMEMESPLWQTAGNSIAMPGLDVGEEYIPIHPIYRGATEWNAVEKFFGLTSEAAWHLFMPSSYDRKDRTDPKAVARRIRVLVANEGRF